MLDLLWVQRCAGCGAERQGTFCDRCAPGAVRAIATPPPGVRGGWWLDPYDAPPGRALQIAKYRPDRRLMVALGAHLADRLEGHVRALGPDWLVPAPSPWTTRLRRGFASAAVLATELSRRTGVPVRHALTVTRGARQAATSSSARRRNLSGRVRSLAPAPGTVVLVDDVLTTGATADACARELLGDETRAVWLVVLCLAGQDATRTGVQNL